MTLIGLLVLSLVFTGCKQTISGMIVDKSKHTPHFTLEVGEYHYKVIETTIPSWDTLQVGDYIEFKCMRGRRNRVGCLYYDKE